MIFTAVIYVLLISILLTYWTIYLYIKKDIIIRWFNRKKAAIYKKKKIKESKFTFDKDYQMKFKVFLKDKSGNHSFVDEFEIEIPAKAPFFARKELEKYIKENICIDITDIKEKQ